MTPTHDSFTLTRDLRARPARVFAAWAEEGLKRRWFVDHDGPEWETLDYRLDFRVGGTETGTWRMTATDKTLAGEHGNRTTYLDIVPDRRIVYAYTMAMGGRVHSASLATVTFAEQGDGTRLTYTEQGTYLEGSDGQDMRKGGWAWLLDNLEVTLKEATAA